MNQVSSKVSSKVSIALHTMYLFELIKQAQLMIHPRVNGTAQAQWQYPIVGKFPDSYYRYNAQSLLELSYRVSVHNREVNDGISDPLSLNPPGFDIVIPIDCTYMFMKVNVAWFFYSSSMNIAVVVATATYNNILSIVDLSYLQEVPNITNYVEGMKVHGGFWGLYEKIQPNLQTLLGKYINVDTQIILTGLSLGGAISTIAVTDLYQLKLNNGVTIKDIIHYSFASPRLFNIVGAEAYKTLKICSEQIHNGSDIIPVVPLPIMPTSIITSETQDFMHVGDLTYFDRNLGSYYDNHVTAYLEEYNVTA